MKKIILSLILVFLCVIITPFFTIVYADEDVKINTIYPENIIDYEDLTNIEHLTIDNQNVAYVTSNTDEKITIINKTTREKIYINDITNILDMKFFNSILLIATTNDFFIYKDNQLNKVETLSNSNYKLADIHINKDTALLGFIKNNNLVIYNMNKSFEISNPIIEKTYEDISSAYILTINNSQAYIVTTPSPSSHKIYSIDLNSKAHSYDIFISNISILETVRFNNIDYLIAFSQSAENLALFKKEFVSSENEYNYSKINSSIIDTGEYGIKGNNHFPIKNVKDIEIFDNVIYLCDSGCKTIQSYIIVDNNSNLEIHSQDILISSDSSYAGRFNSLNDIKIHNGKIFTADTNTNLNNNRIQILSGYDNCTIEIIENLQSIDNIEIDKHKENTIYVTSNNEIIQFVFNVENNKYVKNNYFNVTTNNIVDITIDNDNILYILNENKNSIEYTNNNNVINFKTFDFNITNNAQILYLKQKNCFVLLNNTSLYLLDNSANILDSIENIYYSEISCDLENIYTLYNNKINLITVSESNKLVETNKFIEIKESQNINNICIDNSLGKILFYDTNKKCLSYIDNTLTDTKIKLEDISSESYPVSETNLTPIKLNEDTLVYNEPYYLDTYINLGTDTECIGIAKLNDFYKIIYNYNNELHTGYIHESNIDKIIATPTKININAIVTNQNVPIYKYPTILKYNNKIVSIGNLTIDTKVKLIYKFPISIDKQSMYLIEYEDTIGFLSSSSVIESSKNIENLYGNNATVTTFGSSNEINIYAEDKTTIVYTIKDGDKIYANNYDKDSEYTHVFFTTDKLETIEGYVKTENIKMDKLDNSKIILIVIITISIFILIAISIFYFHLRKKPR